MNRNLKLFILAFVVIAVLAWVHQIREGPGGSLSPYAFLGTSGSSATPADPNDDEELNDLIRTDVPGDPNDKSRLNIPDPEEAKFKWVSLNTIWYGDYYGFRIQIPEEWSLKLHGTNEIWKIFPREGTSSANLSFWPRDYYPDIESGHIVTILGKEYSMTTYWDLEIEEHRALFDYIINSAEPIPSTAE